MTKHFFIVLSLLVGLGGFGLSPARGEQAVTTTFIGSTIETVDQESQMVTIRTPQGKSWSFQVASADLIEDLHQGDRASLELDLEGRVKKIVKTTAEPAETNR